MALFGAIHIFLAYRNYAQDDAYITYRYAQNLAAGKGFVFNPGERVLGTSTPLYALVLAALALAGLDIPLASGLLFAGSLAGTALVGAALLRRHGHGALSVLWATLVSWAAGDLLLLFGMEIPFYLLLLFLALRAALYGRGAGLGVLLGLAFLTRNDAALFAACLLGLLWLRERRLPVKTAAVTGMVVAPWLVFSWVYFGSIFPNTLAAKAHDVEVTEYMHDAVVKQVWNLFSPVYHFWPSYLVPAVLVSLATLALMGPIFAVSHRLIRREPLLAQCLLFPIVLWLGYSLIAPPLGHYWYLVPGTYFLLLLSLLSWGEMLDGLRFAKASQGIRVAAGALVSVLLVVLTIAYLPAKVRAHATRWMEGPFYRGRIGSYLTFARWIGERGLGDARVLMREPGYFAYQSGNPMIDGAGLVTPEIRFHGPRERQTPPGEILETHRPDLVITPPLYWPGLPLESYVPLYHAVPARTLYARRSFFEARFSALARQWLAPDPYYPGRPVLRRHPLEWDFEPDGDREWATGGDIKDFVGSPRPVRYRRGRFTEPHLHTWAPRRQWGTVSSPPFVIDFDELTFRFAGTHPRFTLARLLVDGQAVLVQGGAGARPLRLRNIKWPVWSWRGKAAVLQFRDADIENGFLVADHVRSLRYQDMTVLDDFEADGYGELWETGFGEAPRSLAGLAEQHGLGFLVGRRAALSLGQPDRASMRSRPFVIDRDHLSLLIFDFGGARTGVELRVGDRVEWSFSGTRSGRLQPVVWNVEKLIGREAVLQVVDGLPGDEAWIGIDDIALFDRPSVPEPAARSR